MSRIEFIKLNIIELNQCAIESPRDKDPTGQPIRIVIDQDQLENAIRLGWVKIYPE